MIMFYRLIIQILLITAHGVGMKFNICYNIIKPLDSSD